MTVELKTRQVTSDFINSFQEKLVYVGEPGETSEEFEKITNKSRRWRHIDMTGMKMPRWSLTVMSKMVFLHTLVLDSCELDARTLGFVGCVPTVTTLCLNKNKFEDYVTTSCILSRCFPVITFLSLLGNPFYVQLNDDNEIIEYRRLTASKNQYLRFLDGTPLAETASIPTDVAEEVSVDEPDSGETSTGGSSVSTSGYRRVRHYRGTKSEGNRYIKNVQL